MDLHRNRTAYWSLLRLLNMLSSFNVNMTIRNEYVITTAIARIAKQAAPPPQDPGGSLNTTFAGLSVLLACLALVIGLLQLRKHRKSNHLSVQHEIHELEAGSPDVRSNVRIWTSYRLTEVK